MGSRSTMVFTPAPATQMYDEYGKAMTLKIDNTTTGANIITVPLCVEAQPTNFLSASLSFVGGWASSMQSGLDCKKKGMTEAYKGDKSGLKYGAYLDAWTMVKSVL